MNIAFKEWAIIVDALARGEQIFILRKGGIHEGRGGFQPEHREFLLFPTLFHQQRESVIPPAQKRFDEIAPFFPESNVLRLQYLAELVEWHQIESLETLKRLRPQHIWKDEVLLERFEWGKERAIYALALRVFQLPVALELPMLPEYGGCKSWVEVAHPITTNDCTPAIPPEEFEKKLSAFRNAISTHAEV